MTMISRRLTGLLILTSALFGAVANASTPASTNPDARAANTLARMTFQEKLSLLQTVLLVRMPPDKRPKDVAVGVGYTPGVPRLGIPPIDETDGSLGVANMGGFIRPNDGATALPSGLAMGSTWNPSLIESGGKMIGAEARAKGFNVMLAGGDNLVRDPRNGRNFEYFSEDPLLSGTLAGSIIRGIQSNHIISTLKHYAFNDQESGRLFYDVQMGEAAMRESDLLAFEIANEIGKPGAVMCAYNKVNGRHACANDFLLNRVLRDDWGFKGWVMSDWGAVHSVSIGDGLDQESGVNTLGDSYFGKALRDDIASGKVSEEEVDLSAKRILRTMYGLGVVDHRSDKGPAINFDADGKVAETIAEQGIVLLKNAGNLLPLPASARKIVVIGAHADVGVLSGGGSSQVWPVGGAALSLPVRNDKIYHRKLYMPSSPLTALRKQFPKAKFVYDDGTDPARAAMAARDADFAIVFAEQFMAEGYDALSLNLPDGQNALIKAVARANPKTTVVLETGGPVLMPWLDGVPAVIEAWYAGQRGGQAIARILSGAVNPSGHLPVTFPASVAQLPNPVLPGSDRTKSSVGSDRYDLDEKDAPLVVHYPEGSAVGYRWYADNKMHPLFAFGHGLSYTSFVTSDPEFSGTRARFSVRNTGHRKGATVVQLYLLSRAGDVRRRLVGYQRVELAPNASKSVSINIDPRLLADWKDGGWSMPKGKYVFAIGESAQHLGHKVSVRFVARHWKD